MRDRRRHALEQALRMSDSYTRMQVLVELGFLMPLDEWLVVLGREWTCCDNIGKYYALLRRMMPDGGPLRQMMTSDEQAAYDALPDRLTVYRGCGAANKRGASWSVSRSVATRFPFLMRYRAADPLLITAAVLKRRVLAVKLDRGEAEVITFHCRVTAVQSLDRPEL